MSLSSWYEWNFIESIIMHSALLTHYKKPCTKGTRRKNMSQKKQFVRRWSLLVRVKLHGKHNNNALSFTYYKKPCTKGTHVAKTCHKKRNNSCDAGVATTWWNQRLIALACMITTDLHLLIIFLNIVNTGTVPFASHLVSPFFNKARYLRKRKVPNIWLRHGEREQIEEKLYTYQI